MGTFPWPSAISNDQIKYDLFHRDIEYQPRRYEMTDYHGVNIETA
jgi:hypothetical protein